MRKRVFILVSIVLLAAVLRFYEIGKNPPSLNLDEVAIGYNAYSILRTGRDEYGESFPLSFRSHDDYKPPLYIYLTVPSVAAFGLSEIAVRFPSAFFGTVSVLMIYFLAKALIDAHVDRIGQEKIALLCSFLLAVNPWHLQFSRAGFETNVALFFFMTGIWAFLRGMKKNGYWWVLTAVMFGLSMYTYQAARVFIPLMSLSMLILYWKQRMTHVKQVILAGIVFVLIVLPLIPIATSTAGVMRFKGTNVFTQPGLVEDEVERSFVDADRQDAFSMKVLHNQKIAATLTIAEGYLKHFRPDVLFLGRNGPPYNYTPNVGLFYIIELPLMLWGFAKLSSRSNKAIQLSFFWLLLAPVAAALTWDVPSSTRTMLMLPPLLIFTSVGAYEFFIKRDITHRFGATILGSAVLLTLVGNISYYLHQYYIHAPLEFADAWQYGYKQAVEYAESQKGKYDKVVVSTYLKQPQNFFAFYSKYDPKTYIEKDGGTVSGGFLESRNKFDKYEFRHIEYADNEWQGKIMFIDLEIKLTEEIRSKAIKTINLPNGEPYIVISEL